jgi:rod shape-determining protein MreC
MRDVDPRRSRAVLGLLLLASLTVITLDARRDATGSSPVDPLRTATGAVLGPVETAAASVAKPISAVPHYFGNVSDLRRQNARLEAADARLTTRLRAEQANSRRSSELRRIGSFADTAGYSVVPAQVVAMGPAQSFFRTVTVDAGTDAGVVPDLTVINGDGLVGRVISAGPETATVLLITDTNSVVGGRLSDSMELGFLTGNGQLGGDAALKLSLVDHTVSPRPGAVVVSWGSRGGAPYVPGVPVGSVVRVHSSLAELTETAEIRPYVDFSSLDVVGIVTGSQERAATTSTATGRLSGARQAQPTAAQAQSRAGQAHAPAGPAPRAAGQARPARVGGR